MFQEKFAKYVSLLTKEFNQVGSPYGPDEWNELIQIGTKDAVGDAIVSNVRQIEEIGNKQYNVS